MELRALVERILSRGARATKPSPSVFGAAAHRDSADRAKAQAYEFEVAREKGRPRGF